MPLNISVYRLIRHTFIFKAKFFIIRNKPLLACQNKTFAALLLCIVNRTTNQLCGVSVFAIIRQCIHSENHLPSTIFIVHGCFSNNIILLNSDLFCSHYYITTPLQWSSSCCIICAVKPLYFPCCGLKLLSR